MRFDVGFLIDTVLWIKKVPFYFCFAKILLVLFELNFIKCFSGFDFFYCCHEFIHFKILNQLYTPGRNPKLAFFYSAGFNLLFSCSIISVCV